MEEKQNGNKKVGQAPRTMDKEGGTRKEGKASREQDEAEKRKNKLTEKEPKWNLERVG
jgi:hypothetical protein